MVLPQAVCEALEHAATSAELTGEPPPKDGGDDAVAEFEQHAIQELASLGGERDTTIRVWFTRAQWAAFVQRFWSLLGGGSGWQVGMMNELFNNEKM